MAKKELEGPFFIHVHETLYVCDHTTLDNVRHKAIKALKAGRVVIWQNKDRQWLSWNAHVDLSKEGGDMYTWDKSFNKAKHDIILHTKRNGVFINEIIGTTYRRP
jgi:hypothetical protein